MRASFAAWIALSAIAPVLAGCYTSHVAEVDSQTRQVTLTYPSWTTRDEVEHRFADAGRQACPSGIAEVEPTNQIVAANQAVSIVHCIDPNQVPASQPQPIEAPAPVATEVSPSQASAPPDSPPHPKTVADVSAEFSEHVAQCHHLFAERHLKTHEAAVACVYNGFPEMMQSVGYPYMDLVQVQITEELAIAERQDRRQISRAEAGAEEAELSSRLATEEKSRLLADAQAREAAQAQANAAAAQQQQEEAQTQAQIDLQTQLLEQQQAQAAAEADAERRAALLRFSAGMLAPSRTGGFADSLSNGFGAAAGIPPPPLPVQTHCERDYGGGINCTSQ